MLSRINLNEVTNAGCKTRCNQQSRFDITENGICKEVKSIVDNLPIRCVGYWSVEKVYLLYQYFGIFSNGMKNKWEINYIEICCGTGRCISRESGTEFDGTSLCITKHPAFSYIHKALFFDFDQIVVNTLKSRLGKLNLLNAQVLIGDYNNPIEISNKIIREINPNSLSLVFIDPTDCSLPFELIRLIKKSLPKIDLIINVATGTDYNRNIKEALLDQIKFKDVINKYNNFLGSDLFFLNNENIELARAGNNLELRTNFRNSYKNSLENIGYEYFNMKRIHNLYDILFASSDKKGLEFWDKVNKYKFDGQKSIF